MNRFLTKQESPGNEKEAFVHTRNEMEKIALTFGPRKKQPNEVDELITQRNQAVEELKKNDQKLKDLNNSRGPIPTPAQEVTPPASKPAPKPLQEKTQPAAKPTPAPERKPIKDFGEYFKESPAESTTGTPAESTVGSRVENNSRKPKLNKGRVGLAVGGALATGAAATGLLKAVRDEDEKVAFEEVRIQMEKIALYYK